MSNLPDRIRWDIIGCGDVTEKKSGPGLRKATGSTLVAVMDTVLDAYYGGRSDPFWTRPSTWPERRPAGPDAL